MQMGMYKIPSDGLDILGLNYKMLSGKSTYISVRSFDENQHSCPFLRCGKSVPFLPGLISLDNYTKDKDGVWISGQ